MKPIYLDNAATTPLHPAVLEQMLPYLTEVYGNASSIHAYGRRAQAALSDARDRIAGSLGCEGKQIVFTGGGTESDNLALFGTAARRNYRGHIITTQIEHHAILHTCARLEELGCTVTYLPVDSTGRVRVVDVQEAIRPDTFLISIMYGNNEVGTLQPVEEIGNLARGKGILFHSDAVQALGMESIDLTRLPVDFMSFSAHKIRGPVGIGALYLSPKATLTPLVYGGNQERGRRAGTENVAGAVGFAAAVELAVQDIPAKRERLERLSAALLGELQRNLLEGQVVVNGNRQYRLPHILNLSFPGVPSETMLMNLDLEGIAAASGSACTSGSLELSHVLKAMNLPEERLLSAVRFSFGEENTLEEISAAVKKIETIVTRIRIK